VARLERGEVRSAMAQLFSGLLELRRQSEDDDWQAFARHAAIEHPVRAWLHTDPMARRSFEKPRGYAGDAVLLDYIYGLRVPDPHHDRARSIYDYAVTRPSADAVRERRLRIAEILDHTAARCPGDARVFSIACGHLREAEISGAMTRGEITRFDALDADPKSLEVVATRLQGVTVREGSFASLLRDKSVRDTYDFVYSAGLFDYLQQGTATKLLETMFAMLRPGGRLLLSNFLPSVVDAGYMETYMGWHLIYRDLDQLTALATRIPREAIARARAYEDSHRAIGYLELTRARS
jgi:SAM-dependent methyltransferase